MHVEADRVCVVSGPDTRGGWGPPEILGISQQFPLADLGKDDVHSRRTVFVPAWLMPIRHFPAVVGIWPQNRRTRWCLAAGLR